MLLDSSFRIQLMDGSQEVIDVARAIEDSSLSLVEGIVDLGLVDTDTAVVYFRGCARRN